MECLYSHKTSLPKYFLIAKKKNNKSNFWAEESNIYNWSSCKVTVSNEANQQVPKNRFNKRQTYSLFWQNS